MTEPSNPTPLPSSPLHLELQEERERLERATELSSAEIAETHRRIVYLALDVGEQVMAMQHALACLDIARALGDLPLQSKAHVAVALVLADAYDDIAAEAHFTDAERIAKRAGYVRGVALAYVNRSHFLLQRGEYRAALEQLLLLQRTPFMHEPAEPANLQVVLVGHINYTVAACETLRSGQSLPGERGEVERFLEQSVTRLSDPDAQQLGIANRLDVLDALTRHETLQGHTEQALQLATERVTLAQNAQNDAFLGFAFLERGRALTYAQRWEDAARDFTSAAEHFERAGNELYVTRARDELASTYARMGRYEEAFDTQRAVTRRTEDLFAQFYQQRARLAQVEQQARDAEVRAAVMAEAALRDGLTGAPNRTHAMQVLQSLDAQARNGNASAVALMDLDHFKRVNDTYGHAAGDEVLTRVVEYIHQETRDGDTVARFGGEEFVLIFASATLEEATRICLRLRTVIRDIDWQDVAPGLRVTASFGVAALDGTDSLKATLQAADRALYAAKAAGRDCVRVATH